jgi:hypothetical protein
VDGSSCIMQSVNYLVQSGSFLVRQQLPTYLLK